MGLIKFLLELNIVGDKPFRNQIEKIETKSRILKMELLNTVIFNTEYFTILARVAENTSAPFSSDMSLFAAAGFIGGFAYWTMAGARA